MTNRISNKRSNLNRIRGHQFDIHIARAQAQACHSYTAINRYQCIDEYA